MSSVANRKCKAVRLHIAINVPGSPLTLETVKHDVDMTITPVGVHVLQLKQEKERLVPWANIIDIELMPEEKAKTDEKAKK